MFRVIRRHLTPGTAIAFVALVFALTGGAFAATGGGGSHATLTAGVAKKKSKAPARGPAGPKGATGATGPAGPAGAAGPQGAAGAKGETGAAGANGANGTEGTNGTNGKSVTSTPLSAGNHTGHCPEGGSQFTVGASESYACNGEKGAEGNIKASLSPGETETGTIYFAFSEGGVQHAALSFPIPLGAPLEAHFCGEGKPECHVHIRPLTFRSPPSCTGITEPHELKECEEEVERVEAVQKSTEASCQGTVDAPSAEPGNLCIYTEDFENISARGEFGEPTEGGTVGVSGMIWTLIVEGSSGLVDGTWAMREAS
jgi:hypothetical protein